MSKFSDVDGLPAERSAQDAILAAPRFWRVERRPIPWVFFKAGAVGLLAYLGIFLALIEISLSGTSCPKLA
jgi:hypothetical protein